MQVSDELIDHLLDLEGYRDQVYDDATGKPVSSYEEVRGYPTIGVGHYITADQRGQFAPYLKGGAHLSRDQVMDLFRADISRFERELSPRIAQPLTQSMWDALISQAFNTGSNSRSVKAAVAAINAQDYEAAARALGEGPTTSKGRQIAHLVKRRLFEMDLFRRDGMPGEDVWLWVAVAVSVSAVGACAAIWWRRRRRRRQPGR